MSIASDDMADPMFADARPLSEWPKGQVPLTLPATPMAEASRVTLAPRKLSIGTRHGPHGLRLDTTGDGKADAVGIDTTGDGQIDTIARDTTQDGLTDHHFSSRPQRTFSVDATVSSDTAVRARPGKTFSVDVDMLDGVALSAVDLEMVSRAGSETEQNDSEGEREDSERDEQVGRGAAHSSAPTHADTHGRKSSEGMANMCSRCGDLTVVAKEYRGNCYHCHACEGVPQSWRQHKIPGFS